MAPKKKPSRPKQLGRLAATTAAPGGPAESEQPEVQATSSTPATSLVPAGPPVLDLSTASIQELCGCHGYARALQLGTPVLLRNPAGWVNGWSDVFDLEAPAAEAWWLSPIPGQAPSPLDVDHAQLPTMTARLRVAKAAAAQGTRLGLIKAVALSLDTAGPGPKGWTQKHLALNAINKLLFRRKVYSDTYGTKQAREEFEQLPAADRRLFQQVHAAMNSLDDAEPYAPAIQVNYTTSVAYRGVEQAWYNMSPRDARHDMLGTHAHQGGLENVEAFFVGTGEHRLLPHVSMSAAYTYLLACYTLKGADHADTRTALRQARNRDPQAWVPKLLAGLAYPPVSAAPAVAAGSRQEAWGYVRAEWASWCRGLDTQGEHIVWVCEGQPLHWLLQQCQLPIPTTKQQGQLANLWCVTCYAPEFAFSKVEPLGLEVQRVFNSTSGPGRIESMRQLGGVGALRNLVVLLCSMATLTYNLPPVDAAPALWQEVVGRVRWPTLDGARRRVHMCALALLPVAQHVLRMYEGLTPHQLAEAGAVHAGEVEEMAALLGSLQPVAARWLWQVGDVRAAKQVAVDALAAWQQPKRVAMQWSASNEPPQAAGISSSSSSTSGIQYASSWQRIADFVAAETMAALRGGRLKQRRGGGGGGSSSSSSSSSSQGLVATGVADPVFLMPSEWLDELVGWQVGRRVKVCFNMLSSIKGKEGSLAGDQAEEEDIATTYADSKGRVEVMLQGSDGRRTDFNWGQEGDAHEVNMWKAMQDTLNSDEEDDEEDEEEDWVIEGDAGQGTISTTPWPGNPSVTVQQALLEGLDDIMNGIFGVNVNSSTGGGTRPAATPAAAAPAGRAASAGQAKAATTPAAAAAAAAAASRGAGTAVTDGAVVQQTAGTQEPGPAAAGTRGGGSGSSSSSNTPPTQSSRAAAVGAGAGAGGGQPAPGQQATAQQPAPGAARGLKPCAWCGTQLPKLQKCSRCKRVGYCCKEHQVEHWPIHKQECAAASAAQ